MRGQTDQKIAEELSISPNTARTHAQNIFTKLHVHSRAEAVAVAIASVMRSGNLREL
jgi:DNA-binding NarL/FixJ family response regulator